MKIRAIALHAFGSFLHNKIFLLFGAIFVCVLLFMMTPLLSFKAMMTGENAQQMQAMVLGIVSAIMSLVSGFGSLLAIWAAADAIASELRSGTILAVMARPVRRWEFLLGKYLGVQLVLVVYVLLAFGLGHLLARLGGQRIHASLWTLIVYPLVRYAVYSAIAMLLATTLHPIVTIAIVLVISTLATVVAPTAGRSVVPAWVRTPLYVLLPSTDLLSEDRFVAVTQAALKQTPWVEHATALAYGLDYAVVCLLLAMWSFHYRRLV